MSTILPIEQYTPDFNKLASHPLQSWQWGEFRKKTGIKVYRFGEYKNGTLVNVYQLTLHKIPNTPFKIGYVPKSRFPSNSLLTFLKNYFENKKVIFIKFEPNVEKMEYLRGSRLAPRSLGEAGTDSSEMNLLTASSRPLFTKYTFQIDLTKSEDELLKQMKSKTRYNVRLALKKGVKVTKDNSDRSFETYLKLQKETTKRQKFYAHNEKYHRLLWETLKPAGIAHILNAVYAGETLVSWMVFLFHDVLYYPYGGSSNKYRNLMPSNLMLWEAMLWGKRNGAKLFDLWGALGPYPDPKDPWYGFHRFKEGYGGRLVEFAGSYDFVLNPLLYRVYNFIDSVRWAILRFIQK